MTQTTPQAAGTQNGAADPILQVTNLVKHYPLMGGGVIRRRIGDVHVPVSYTHLTLPTN